MEYGQLQSNYDNFFDQPTTAVHGAPLNITASVVASSGTAKPTGSLWVQGGISHGNLIGDSTQLVLALDPTGSVSTTTHVLLGGTYSLNAHYAGDGTFAPSDSTPPVTVTIQPEPTTTTLAVLAKDASGTLVPFTGGPYGTALSVQAHVSGQSGYGNPTSYVNFWDNMSTSVASNVYVNRSGDAVSTVSQLGPGPHSISGGYYGDASFSSSISAALNFKITQATTTTVVTSQPASQGVTLNATVSTSSFGATPTGTVTFYSGSTALGSASVNATSGATATGIASITASQLAVGQYNISASYAGDTNYSASTSSAAIVNVVPDFVLSTSLPNIAVQPGLQGTLTLSITAQNGYNGVINFGSASCTGLPLESSCSFAPPSVTGAGSTILTISTMGPHAMFTSPVVLSSYLGASAALGGVALPGLLLFGVPSTRRRLRAALTLVIIAFLIASFGCGGGGGGSSTSTRTDPGTSRGAYTVTVTGVSGTTTHTTSFLMQVI